MNGKMKWKRIAVCSAKECAFIAVFVAMVLAAQLALSAVPGVEVVTVLFASYAFVFGVKRGMTAATVFSLLRQLIFGFFPTVLILYVLYYNILTATFALLGSRVKNPVKGLWILVVFACICTVSFTLIDDIVTPWFLGYGLQAWQLYVYASLPVMGVQTACSAVSVAVLFLPLQRTFLLVARLTRIKECKKQSESKV